MNSAEQIPPGRRRGLFLGLIWLLFAPLWSLFLRLPAPADVPDMRALVAWPDWSATGPARWPSLFEPWLNDHFPLRAWIIRWHSFVQLRIMGAATSNVLVGREHWLFFIGDHTLEDLRGRDPLSEQQLLAWRNALEGRQGWLQARGIGYLFVVVPNKSSIHSEKLPWLLQMQLRPGKLDQLVGYLHAHSTVPVLDLRPALLALKAQGQPVYWPGDTHWNGHGLVAAYVAIMEKLGQLGMARRASDDVAHLQVDLVPRNFDCVDMIAMRGHWPDTPTPALRIAPPPDLRISITPLLQLSPWKDEPNWKQPVAYERDSGAKRAVMFCDSFMRFGGVPFDALAQTPFILSFHRFVSCWDRSDFAALESIVAQETPDVVIEQTTERFLGDPLPNSPGFSRP